jgi:hypothetical protein
VNLLPTGRDQTSKRAVDGSKIGRTQGMAIMLMFRIISGIFATALGAAVVLAWPGFSPEVEARTPASVTAPAPATKSDRLEIRPAAPATCGQQAWPYYETNCLRERPQGIEAPRTIRLVTTDRLNIR